MERLKRLVVNYDIDLVCLLEVNKDWRSVQQEHTIWNGTSAWCKNRRVQVSFNSTKTTRGAYLVSGTAMVTFNGMVFHICKQGADSRKLGRWSFSTTNGKNGVETTFITVYYLVVSNSPGSSYSQQSLYMAEHQDKVPAGMK